MSDLDDWETNDYSNVAVKDSWDDDADIEESWESLDKEQIESESGQKNDIESEDSKQSAPIKKKRTLKQILAEKEEKERQEAKNISSTVKEPQLTAEERRQKEQKMVQDADLENAKDLFGSMSIEGGASDNLLMTMAPRTRADFEKFASIMAERALTLQKSPFYPLFCELLTRSICDPLNVIDITKVSSALTALGNERRREAKSGQKKKKASAPAGPKMSTKGAKYEFGGYDENTDDTEFLTGGAGSNAGKYDVYDDFM